MYYQHGTPAMELFDMINKITRAAIRVYSDTAQHKALIWYINNHGHYGKLEGKPNSLHMLQLLRRAQKECVTLERQIWYEQTLIELFIFGCVLDHMAYRYYLETGIFALIELGA